MKVEVPFPSERRKRNECGEALPMCALSVASSVLTWLRVLGMNGLAVARRIRSSRLGRLRWWKRRAKEEILARYASFIYMGNGQYGFGTASEYFLAGLSPRSPSMMLTKQRCWQASQSRLATTRLARTKPGEFYTVEIKLSRLWRRTDLFPPMVRSELSSARFL